jgi:hypothetical protein
VVQADTGACEDAEPWGTREKRGIDHGVGSHDRTHGVGDVLFVWIGDERNVIAEDASD